MYNTTITKHHNITIDSKQKKNAQSMLLVMQTFDFCKDVQSGTILKRFIHNKSVPNVNVVHKNN